MQFNVAIVHDALPFYGGAERTLEALLELYPAAPVYTILHRPEVFSGTTLARADIRASWLDSFPGIHANHYRYFPLFPLAVRSFDLRGFDVVISSHYAVAHWARTTVRQVHIAYVYTPLRYLWQRADALADRFAAPLRPAVRLSQRLLRRLDRTSARRVSRFVAVSAWTAGLIRHAYGREAEVVYPPVDVLRFRPSEEPRSGFVCVARLAAHKKLEVVVAAFNRLGLPLEIIGNGPERARLEGLAGPNISFSGGLTDEEVARRLGNARGFVHMAAEDFGIAVVEAQAAGCPVIAYRGGANPETVVDGRTGLLVPEQSAAALETVVRRFLEIDGGFHPDVIRAHAVQFSRDRFKAGIQAIILDALKVA